MLFPVKKRMTNSILGLYDLQTPDLVDRGTVSFFHLLRVSTQDDPLSIMKKETEDLTVVPWRHLGHGRAAGNNEQKRRSYVSLFHVIPSQGLKG